MTLRTTAMVREQGYHQRSRRQKTRMTRTREGGEEADVEEDDEEEEEDEEQAALLAKVKKMNIWEFHGVMYLALMEVRANGHIKGGGEGEGKGKKGKKGKKKK